VFEILGLPGNKPDTQMKKEQVSKWKPNECLSKVEPLWYLEVSPEEPPLLWPKITCNWLALLTVFTNC